jgi:O-methyltransferase
MAQTTSSEPTPIKRSKFERRVREWYRSLLAPLARTTIGKQRIKLLYNAWGYRHLLAVRTLPLGARLRLVAAFLRVDWNVPHAHNPLEIAAMAAVLSSRRANPGEVVVEAGCWQGGSTAKLSLLCARQGFALHVFDSFQGVEPNQAEPGFYDYSGEYSATESLVRSHVARFGEISVCTFHPGWFADTIAQQPLKAPVRMAYIDCDLVKGTHEVLAGVMPTLTNDGVVFSQDFHIKPVRRILVEPETWHGRTPQITVHARRLVSVRFH